MLAATSIRPSSVLRASFSASARTQLGLFLFAYLVYSAGRWITVGDLGVAKANAAWIMNAEHTTHVAVEASVQRALEGLTGRFPGLRLVEGRPMPFHPNISFRGPLQLWVQA